MKRTKQSHICDTCLLIAELQKIIHEKTDWVKKLQDENDKLRQTKKYGLDQIIFN